MLSRVLCLKFADLQISFNFACMNSALCPSVPRSVPSWHVSHSFQLTERRT